MKTHFFDMNISSVDKNKLQELKWEKSTTIYKNEKEIPKGDNILVFEWIFSQNFKKWEVSRNWYKYIQDGWVVDNYARMPIILWQHNDAYGWIWFTSEIWQDSKWNLVWLFWVDLDMLEERNAKQVKWWFVSSISTWAITLEDWFEEIETWKIYSQDEARDKFWFENILDALFRQSDRILNYVVTKAELVENSLVTIWSNYWAIAKSVNTLSDEMREKAEELKKNKSSNDETLHTNYKSDMSKADIEKTLKDDVAPETKSDKVEDKNIDKVDDVETDKVEDKDINKKENSVEALQNKITELENSFDTYKNEVEKEIKELKETNSKLDKTNRDEVLENAPQINKWDNKSDLKSIWDFKDKWKK